MADHDSLAALTVLDENKVAVAVPELWKQGPIVLVFVRHFG